MRDKNLFGEMQEYYDPIEAEQKKEAESLKRKIKKMIKDNGDYDFYVDNFDHMGEKIPTFDEFFEEQIDWLITFYKTCKSWEDFTGKYYYTSITRLK